MEITDLQDKINVLITTFDEITNNRNIWHKSKKAFILQALIDIINRYQLSWDVQEKNDVTNAESVCLFFLPQNSGIFGSKDGSFQHFIKNGGAILFRQLFNGEIKIEIVYPTIEQYAPKYDYLVLDIIKPEKITRDFIFKKVNKFIEEMIQWELGRTQ